MEISRLDFNFSIIFGINFHISNSNNLSYSAYISIKNWLFVNFLITCHLCNIKINNITLMSLKYKHIPNFECKYIKGCLTYECSRCGLNRFWGKNSSDPKIIYFWFNSILNDWLKKSYDLILGIKPSKHQPWHENNLK